MSHNTGYLKAKSTPESDLYYTPKFAITPLLKYLPSCSTIWCPFDDEWSNYVSVFRDAGHNVICSHIENNQDFFSYEPSEPYDFIISNPPFSIKDKVLARLSLLNHPYAMLLPLPTLQGQKRFDDLKDCQALIFDKRINYYKDRECKELGNAVSFGSIYICKNLLPRDLIFERL